MPTRVSAGLILVVPLVAACSAIAGLDQITEADCAPNCGDGDAASVDVAAEADAPEGADASSRPDTNRPDQDSGAQSVDAAAPDGVATSDGPAGDASEMEAAPVEAGPETGPVEAGVDAPVAETGPCGTVFFQDAFDDASKGWTLDGSWSIAKTCASPPAPQKGNPDPTLDHTTGAPGGVAGAYVCGNNPTGNVAAARYATSPPVDVSAAPSVALTFYRWLNSDSASYMTSTIDVWDGAGWVNLYTNPTSVVTDGAWTRETYDLTPYKNAALQVRFGYALLSKTVYAMSCWNVDDVTISTAACP